MNRISVFHLKGLRIILGLNTTFVKRANTNQRVLEIAEQEANKGRGEGQVKKRVVLMSEVLKDKC